MKKNEIIPHLFRTEYRKIIAVLCKVFGLEYIEIAEDIVSDTFLLATELWGQKGLPKNPIAWLYTVSKNKTKDYLKRNSNFRDKIVPDLKSSNNSADEFEIDLSPENINDSQLQMMFAICHPSIPEESQIALSLNVLCGFGAEEIAEAFLTGKDTIYKRLTRAKEKLRTAQIKMELPSASEIGKRLETVLTTLYLLFSEGYYSSSNNTILRKEFCIEAMRLNFMLLENQSTDLPSSNALLSLMCFHASRFDARTDKNGEIILYEDQDTSLWNLELIQKGEYYLNKAAHGKQLSKYHLEASIAYWHTHKTDSKEKWENILQLYNKLLQLEYSPIAALNRTYALAKANNIEEAITEAEKLKLVDNHFYHCLLGVLYSKKDFIKSNEHFQIALQLAKSNAEKLIILNKINFLTI